MLLQPLVGHHRLRGRLADGQARVAQQRNRRGVFLRSPRLQAEIAALPVTQPGTELVAGGENLREMTFHLVPQALRLYSVLPRNLRNRLRQVQDTLACLDRGTVLPLRLRVLAIRGQIAEHAPFPLLG